MATPNIKITGSRAELKYNQEHGNKAKMRRQIEKDVQAFVDNGGEIQKIPFGKLTVDYSAKKK